MSENAGLSEPRVKAAGSWRDYLVLAKARIVVMILITTAAGYVLGSSSPVDWMGLVTVLIGTALVAAGTNGFNEYVERNYDKLMVRTRRRPIPDGRISERAAFLFCSIATVAGVAFLALANNFLAAGVAFLTFFTYIFIYTPLKRRSTICTLVGAFPGALPPLIGWAAAAGSLNLQALLVFGVLFLWQLPHFLAIAWIYREDYARAGFHMTSVRDAEGLSSGRQAFFYSLALLSISVLPGLVHLSGMPYLVGALVAGIALLMASISFAIRRTMRSARQLFLFSNVYLLIMMSVLLIGKATL
ncbi:MAG TPA: heme o synthase [Thermoanaerobaculia bacterium]|nr:heme o synthase [Thermoanaerobaculia bacterium]